MSSNEVVPDVARFAGFIAGKDLTAVAIVDDAFDDWSAHIMRPDEADALWSAIEVDEEARAQLSDHKPDISSGIELNAHVLSEACKAAGPASALEKIVQTSAFRQRLDDKAGAIRAIQFQLSEKFGLKVHTHGAGVEGTAISDEEVQVVFLDWRLGPDHEQRSKMHAAQKARSIYSAFPTGKKPIIVLMSDDNDVKEQNRSGKFRVDSELIEGLFRAVPKEELREDHSLALHMLSIADSLKPAHVVQMFTDAMINRAGEAAKEFVGTIRSLTLSDYANIQHLSLRDDGKPLGDYMCWLFSGFLSDVWFGKPIAKERYLLDQFDFDRMVASPEQPSGTLARIYHAAVFDTSIGPLENHPLAKKQEDGKIDYPNLALGDVFLQLNPSGSSSVAAAAVAADADAPSTAAPAAVVGIEAGAEPTAVQTPPAGEATAAPTAIQTLQVDEGGAAPTAATAAAADVASASTSVQAPPATDLDEAAARTFAAQPRSSEPPAQQMKSGDGIFPAADVLVVVNAQCDLSMSPLQTRKIPSDTAVMLVPGRIRPLGEPGTKSDATFCTPLFVHENAPEKPGKWIEWNLKSLRTVPHGSFEAWAKAEQNRYERIARMRPLPILALQQQLSERNARIGLPVTPPIYRKLPVTLQLVDDKKIKSEYTEQGLAIQVGDPNSERKPHIALTVACLQRIRKHFTDKFSALQAAPSPRLTAADVDKALMEAASWQNLLVPFEFTPKNSKWFGDMLLLVLKAEPQEGLGSRKTLARVLVHLDESELAYEG